MTSNTAMLTAPADVGALAADIDPVRFEVIRNALLAITEEMGATLRRAAYSTNIKTRGDFSCAFFDRQLRTIAQAFAQPSHLGSLAHIVPRAIAAYGADHLMMGTDYPFDMGEYDPLGHLLASGLSAEDVAAIAGGNARRLFGIAG